MDHIEQALAWMRQQKIETQEKSRQEQLYAQRLSQVQIGLQDYRGCGEFMIVPKSPIARMLGESEPYDVTCRARLLRPQRGIISMMLELEELDPTLLNAVSRICEDVKLAARHLPNQEMIQKANVLTGLHVDLSRDAAAQWCVASSAAANLDDAEFRTFTLRPTRVYFIGPHIHVRFDVISVA
jgi:hypothetical protein